MLKFREGSHKGSWNQRQSEHWYSLTLLCYKEEDAVCVCVCASMCVCSFCVFYIAQLQKERLHFNLLFSCTADAKKDRRERPRLFLPLPSLRDAFFSHSAVFLPFFPIPHWCTHALTLYLTPTHSCMHAYCVNTLLSPHKVDGLVVTYNNSLIFLPPAHTCAQTYTVALHCKVLVQWGECIRHIKSY